MAFIDLVINEAGERLAELVTTHDKYLLSESDEMYISTRAAWCRGCGRFTLTESLPNPNKMREWARKRSESIREKDPEYAAKLLQKRLREADLWQAALAARRSAPRCLECGGHDFDAIEKIRTWCDHPGQPGVVIRVEPENPSCMGYAGRLYDIEGRRIEGRHVTWGK